MTEHVATYGEPEITLETASARLRALKTDLLCGVEDRIDPVSQAHYWLAMAAIDTALAHFDLAILAERREISERQRGRRA